MAQIDSLFEFLVGQGGYQLLIPADDNCQVTDAAGTHPMNRVMSVAEVTGILLEALPDSLRQAWSDGERVDFTRRTDAGEFRVRAVQDEEGPRLCLACTPLSYIERLASAARESGAEELILAEGAPAFMRREGCAERLTDGPAMPTDTLAAFLEQAAPVQDGDARPSRFLTALAGAGRARVTLLDGEAGPTVLFRLLPEEVSPPSDLPGTFRELLLLRSGLVLAATPPGRGLTLLLAGLLRMAAAERVAHIVSIEALVEIPVVAEKALLTRCPLGPNGRRDASVRNAMALQPDILFVDEVTDPATLRACLDAARAGTLVVAGCRGSTVAAALDRLLAAVAPEARAETQERLGESLRGAVAQTLCRGIDGKRLAAREVLITMPTSSDSIRAGRLDEVADGIDAVGFSLDDALVRLVVEGKVALTEAEACAIDRKRLRDEVTQRLKRGTRG